MKTTVVEITEEEYLRYKDADYKEMSDFVESIAVKSRYHPAGYSFFKPKIYTNNGCYFAEWKHFRSCD